MKVNGRKVRPKVMGKGYDQHCQCSVPRLRKRRFDAAPAELRVCDDCGQPYDKNVRRHRVDGMVSLE